MLVVLSVHSRGYQRAEFGLHLPLAQHIGAELPSELNLILNGAILLEVPVEKVPAGQKGI